MKRAFPWRCRIPATIAGLWLAFLAVASSNLCADEVQMQNGDRYVGKVLSLSSDTLVVQSEVLGTLRVPRSKVALVHFAAASGTNHLAISTNTLARPAFALQTNAPSPDLAAAFRQLGGQTNLIQQVQKQFLADAGPEANAKFNELLSGLMTGQMDMNGLRAQALSAASQLRDARGDLGAEAGGMLDTYLAILDNFLKETAPAGSNTNAAPPRPPTK